jgi:predicted amidohydrolase YtcJ
MLRTVFTLCLLCCALPAVAATLVHNIQGYTMDDGKRVSFVGLEFDRGKVTALPSDTESLKGSKATNRIDGQGATLLPGMIDAHGHISSHGRSLSAVNLVGSPSEADSAQRVARFIEKHPKQEWILGRGWNQVLWPVKEFPHLRSLDAISGDRAVALNRIDGHAMWANSEALRQAGIDKNTRDPEGGQILRDDKGEATGILIDNAMDLVFQVMPPLTDERMEQIEQVALTDLASYGLTSVHDAGIKAQEVRAFQTLREQQNMAIRVYAMLDVLDPANDAYLRQGPLLDSEEMLVIRSVKISADGALGSRGAALFEDYSDQPGNRGLLLVTDEQLDHHSNRAMAAGYQVCVHAIGDLANARVLDYLEKLIKKHDSRGLRHRNEHSQIIRLQDIPRFAEIGVVASIQPTHATSDKNMAGDRLGEDRLAGAYAWRKLLDSGAHLAGGSDFPVESANPFFGLHAAVTRQSQDNQPEGGWLPGEKISREQALSLFTEDAAWAAHQEHAIGKLLPGYFADFILVRDDYFKVPEQDIWNNQVQATYVAGRRVFSQKSP